jgi:uncharacterized protein YegL
MLIRNATLGAVCAILLAACGGAPDAPADDPVASAADEAATAAADAPAAWPPLGDDAPAPLPVEQLGVANYYVLLDGSGSMLARGCSGSSNKINAAVSALERFIGTVPADANLGFATFDAAGIDERVPLARDNRDAFQQQLSRVRAAGGTPLASSIELAERQITAQAQRQLGYGEYHLVIVTDGRPDPPREDPTEVVDRLLAETPIVVHTIGFCIGDDHVLNQPGRTFYLAADSREDLERGLDSVLAESPSFDVAAFSD